MKHSTSLVSAIVATVAAMALVVPPQASATTLCRVPVNPCPKESRYPTETRYWSFSKETQETEVVTGTTITNCAESWIQYDDNSDHVSLDAFMLSDCGEGCKAVVAESSPYMASMQATGSGNGVLTVEEIALKLTECGFGTGCTATAEEAELVFEGGLGGSVEKDAKLIANEIPLFVSGMGCGTTGTLWAVFYLRELQEPEDAPVSDPPVWMEGEP